MKTSLVTKEEMLDFLKEDEPDPNYRQNIPKKVHELFVAVPEMVDRLKIEENFIDNLKGIYFNSKSKKEMAAKLLQFIEEREMVQDLWESPQFNKQFDKKFWLKDFSQNT
jgi:hypothetical protein